MTEPDYGGAILRGDTALCLHGIFDAAAHTRTGDPSTTLRMTRRDVGA